MISNIAKRENYKKEIEALKEEDKKEMNEWLYEFNEDNLYIPANKNLQELCIRIIVDWGYCSYHHPLEK